MESYDCVNYDEAKQELLRLIAEECRNRLILLTGDADYGKTLLLTWLTMQKRPQCILVHIDLQGEEPPSAILDRLTARLGPKHFADYQRVADAQGARRSAIIQGARVQGSNIKLVAQATGPDEVDHYYAAITLTTRFEMGLQAATLRRPAAILFDSFERADALCAKWLANIFLPIIPHHANLRVLIAGRHCPERLEGPLLPITRPLRLNGIQCSKDIVEYVNPYDLYIDDREAWAENLLRRFRGHPARIRTGIEAVLKT